MRYIMTGSRSSANNDRQVKNVRKEKLTSEEHEACRIEELITTDPKTVNTFFRPVPVLVCERYFSNFDSDTKFDSGTGWPCLWAPAKMQDLRSLVYKTYGMQSIEVQYNNSGVNLGPVFEDGPPPTGKRYRINSASPELEGRKNIHRSHNHDL
jgi:peptide methionine sulfoxide reductase MsrB